MIAVILNDLLYCLTLFLYYIKNKKIDIYFFILSVYTVTALLCSQYYFQSPEKWHLSTFNFVYLFVVLLIFLQPFKSRSISIDTIYIKETKLVKFLSWIYIFCSFVAIYYTLPDTIALFQGGNWGALRADLYAGENIQLYHSSIERIAKNISSYLSNFAGIMAFYHLTKSSVDKKMTILLFISWVVPSFLASTIVASRGMVVHLILKIILLYIIFRNDIPKSRKKYLYIPTVAAFAGLIAYTIIVSVSRFGEDEASSSAFYYLSHSMLAFNDGLMGHIHSYTNGSYFFSWLLNIMGLDGSYNLDNLGGTWGTAFITFIGCLYFDFGPIGTIVFAIINNLMIYAIVKRNSYDLADISLIVFFAAYFLNGVFVSGPGDVISYLMAYVVYKILKISQS